MKSEWKKVKVSELGRIITGKTPKTAISENYGGHIPFLTPSDDMEVKVVTSTAKTLTERGLSEVKSCLIPPRSVCVSCIGSDLGKVVMTSEPTVTNQQINSIIPSSDYDADFIYYAMCILGKKLNFISKTSTAVPIINKSTFSDFEIEVPPLPEQQAIGQVLSALDDKIAINTAINQRLEQIAQAIFKSWFVDGASDDWMHANLASVTTEIRIRVKENKMPVLSAVKTGKLVLSEDYFTKQVYSKDISKYIVVEPNDFAYNPARINIGSIGVNDFDFAGCVSPVYVVFRVEPEYHNFFKFLIKTPSFQEEVRLRASGSVRQSLNYRDFALIEILYPPSEAVRKFNFQYEAIHAMQRQLYEENARLSALRDTLLPRLMSGELSVANLKDIT